MGLLSQPITDATVMAPNAPPLSEQTPLLSSSDDSPQKSLSDEKAILPSNITSPQATLAAPNGQSEEMPQPCESTSPDEGKYIPMSTKMRLVMDQRQATIEHLRSLRELELEICSDHDSRTITDLDAKFEIGEDRKKVIEDVCELHRLLSDAYKMAIVTRKGCRLILALIIIPLIYLFRLLCYRYPSSFIAEMLRTLILVWIGNFIRNAEWAPHLLHKLRGRVEKLKERLENGERVDPKVTLEGRVNQWWWSMTCGVTGCDRAEKQAVERESNIEVKEK